MTSTYARGLAAGRAFAARQLAARPRRPSARRQPPAPPARSLPRAKEMAPSLMTTFSAKEMTTSLMTTFSAKEMTTFSAKEMAPEPARAQPPLVWRKGRGCRYATRPGAYRLFASEGNWGVSRGGAPLASGPAECLKHAKTQALDAYRSALAHEPPPIPPLPPGAASVPMMVRDRTGRLVLVKAA